MTNPVAPTSNPLFLRARQHEATAERTVPYAGDDTVIPNVMSRDEVRNVDQRAIDDFGLPGVVLMENAGRGCVDWLEELGVSGRVVICAGKGNNGGDGFVIARHLENRGYDVRVLLFANPDTLRGDAQINYQVIERARTPIRIFDDSLPEDELESVVSEELAEADWIIDALLGTGTSGSVREPFPAIINAINQASVRTMAIDLPSGQDCDTGLPVDTNNPVVVKADFTATFVARKLGFGNPASSAFTGEVRVIDIGVPHSMFESN
ncbi:MAG: NAD(P)H-hydrate epimerase [Porticoccaceae bacterium]|jgi:NAD(P)H-hydrate epimerase